MAIAMDRDGKSQTASAVDAKHYPEQNEAPRHHALVPEDPEREDIARLAYQLWQERGCPVGSPEEDWYRAEEQLLDESASHRLGDKLYQSSGSVQR